MDGNLSQDPTIAKPQQAIYNTTMKITGDNFKDEFSHIRNILIENDPVGLIDGGAPIDEYDDYIYRIMSGLKECRSENDVYAIVEKHFGGFDLYFEDKAKAAAQKIWKRYGS